MGNYISCTLASSAAAHGRRPTVILPGGNVRHIPASDPTTAAELMLDHPGHFIVHSRSMAVGRRFHALSADEELELGAVYAMFPMNRLGTAATAGDMGRLLLAASKEARRTAQVIPETPPEAAPESCRTKMYDVDDSFFHEVRFRKSLCRNMRPVLDPIREENAF